MATRGRPGAEDFSGRVKFAARVADKDWRAASGPDGSEKDRSGTSRRWVSVGSRFLGCQSPSCQGLFARPRANSHVPPGSSGGTLLDRSENGSGSDCAVGAGVVLLAPGGLRGGRCSSAAARPGWSPHGPASESRQRCGCGRAGSSDLAATARTAGAQSAAGRGGCRRGRAGPAGGRWVFRVGRGGRASRGIGIRPARHFTAWSDRSERPRAAGVELDRAQSANPPDAGGSSRRGARLSLHPR